MRNLSSSDVTGRAPQPPGEKSSDERRQILAQAVANALAQPGRWRVESQSDYNAVVIKGKRTNHVLHLILSLVTFGFWLPVWLILAIMNQEQKHLLTVDAHGNVSTQVEGLVVRTVASAKARRVILPTTRLGWWAVRLASVAALVALLAAPIYLLVPGGEWVNAVLGTPAFAAAVGSGVLAPIAIIRDKERALSVYAALIPLLFLLVFTVLELTVFPEH